MITRPSWQTIRPLCENVVSDRTLFMNIYELYEYVWNYEVGAVYLVKEKKILWIRNFMTDQRTDRQAGRQTEMRGRNLNGGIKHPLSFSHRLPGKCLFRNRISIIGRFPFFPFLHLMYHYYCCWSLAQRFMYVRCRGKVRNEFSFEFPCFGQRPWNGRWRMVPKWTTWHLRVVIA